MDAVTLILLLVVALFLLLLIARLIWRRQRPQLQEELFRPIGLMTTHHEQSDQGGQMQQGIDKNPTTTRLIVGGLNRSQNGPCFLTGIPRVSCGCDDCIKEQRSAYEHARG